MNRIIEITNISKKYKINTNRGNYVALRDVLSNAFRNPFKYAKDKTKSFIKGKEEFWALQDINFSVEKGETIGIIGHNGAGKSTLLKILSQITPPTTGKIKLNGRVASLLEVGTGFNPELTGRENIYLSGAILGMTKEEIKKRFDDIVDFAGVNKFIDTPIKRYSSGMMVRLGFAVAAHLEPDILLVDEVLAVGDAEFQKKCLGKMDEVTKQGGRTILFVSHNMGAVQNLCPKSILLQNGKIKSMGKSSDIINEYIHSIDINNASSKIENEYFSINKINIMPINNDLIVSGADIKIALSISFKQEINNPALILAIKTDSGMELSRFSTYPIAGIKIPKFDKRTYNFSIALKQIPFSGGQYRLAFGLSQPKIKFLVPLTDIYNFDIEPSDFYKTGHLMTKKQGYILIKHQWSLND